MSTRLPQRGVEHRGNVILTDRVGNVPGRTQRGWDQARSRGRACFGNSRRPSVQPLLRVDDLTVSYRRTDGGEFTALDGVTFEIAAGEAVGLLGESGCGKTTLGLTLLGLLPPWGSVSGGTVAFCGRNLLTLEGRELRKVRGAQISMVHQEPGVALNPVRRV